MTRNLHTKLSCLISLLILLISGTVSNAAETDYPNKPLSIVVAYAPGGQGDTFARLVSDKLSLIYKQPVLVDNKPGVSGTVGTRFVAKAKNDGYTLLLGQTGEISVNRLLIKDMGYDPMKELIPVVLIGNAPLVMLAPIDAPYNTVSEFIQQARAKQGEFSYGSVGAGTPGHLSAVALTLGAKIDMLHVPYKGVGPLMADLMAGRLHVFFSSASAALPQIKGGKLKALAVTGKTRHPQLPQVPTVAEAGLNGFELESWVALYVASGTPKEVVQKLSNDVKRAMEQADTKQRADAAGVEVRYLTPDATTKLLERDTASWAKAIKAANIKFD